MHLRMKHTLPIAALLAIAFWAYLRSSTRPAPPTPPAPPSAEALEATRLDAEWLEPVKADSENLTGWSVRAEESDAYYKILERARQTPLRDQKQVAAAFAEQRRQAFKTTKQPARYRRFFQFADLYFHPEAWHGRLVTFRGHARKISEFNVEGENEPGFKMLYEVVMFPADAQQNPVIVICTEIPEDVRVGTHVTDDVSVTGYFFKLYGYSAAGDARKAPLLLAQRIEARPAQVGSPVNSLSMQTVILIVLAALVMVALVVRSFRTDRAFHKARTAPVGGRQAPDFSHIASDEPTDGDAAQSNDRS